MPQIKLIATGEVFTVSENPVWSPPGGPQGLWVCGNHNFTDPTGAAYQVVSGTLIYPVLTPMAFYLAFTPTERINIKKSTDPMVMEFWATYELAAQTNHNIDPNLVSVQEGLAWLATPTTATPAGPGILAATRVAQISQGIPQ